MCSVNYLELSSRKESEKVGRFCTVALEEWIVPNIDLKTFPEDITLSIDEPQNEQLYFKPSGIWKLKRAPGALKGRTLSDF